ncbi:MAG TPA: 50S ribosomal protein L17 [Vicinamibacterales bacterium]|jgi:large subunit ribosomal protein L17|nr:50S ribosomal protein L17 [Vicinamibacterales bacterium]
MRHRVAHRKLGRVTEHRISLLRNQATALLRHEHIETTVPKARELRPFVERLITVAKRGIAAGDAEKKLMNARRHVAQDLADVKVVDKLFGEVAPRFQARLGGYTRLLKIGPRRGDSADMARIELVGSEYNPSLEAEGGAAEAPKATGVRGRLQAAASRLRGKRAADADKRVAEPAPAEPKKRAAKKAKKTDE